MELPQSWTKVTLLSKILAIILFVSLPFIGFYLGVRYQTSKSLYQTLINQQLINQQISPTSVIHNQTATLGPIPTIGNTPYDTWLTYTDEEIGISIKYPDQLLVDQKINLIEKYNQEEYQNQDYYQRTLELINQGFLPDLSISVWLDKNKPELPEGSETMHFNPAIYFFIQRVRNITSTSFKDWLQGESTEEYLQLKRLNIPDKEVYFYHGDGIGQGSFNYVFVKSPSEYVIFKSMEQTKTIENDDIYKQIIYSLEYTK